MRLTPLFVATAIYVASITAGGTLMSMFDIPSAIIVVGIVIGGVMAAHTNALRLIRAGIRGSLAPDQARELMHVAQTGHRLSIASGGLGTLVGLLQMLNQIDDPSIWQPAMAVCLLPLLYGCALSTLFWIPLGQSTKTR